MKFNELPKKDRQGRHDLEMENGTIRSVSISNEDHGCLTAWLNVEFDGGGCGFGGYKLGNADGDNLVKGKNYAAEFIVRCLNTIMSNSYGKWEHLVGQPIRVLHDGLGGGIVAVGNFLKDEWFCPRIEFENKE